ncbi:MAG: hydroxyglutarate oxidase [Gemmatimonadetes bacterium 13_1_40CM_4_69_8]|nr:MAG: hydroxyglutarate oxidase [Gemmatimonadetes bacterium 13_1_40CM_4_69_8]
MSPRYDVAIVGGGIVGLATALALVQRSRGSVVVLEAEGRLAAHQSGHNSGVIHSGLYYKPGSLKAQTCTAGREALYRFCLEEGIPHRRCGKVVVATRPEQLALLELLEQRGRANGLQRLRRLGSEALREREPEVAGLAGLWVEETGVVDFALVAAAYARQVERGGGDIKTNARVTDVRREANGLHIETEVGPVRAGLLVNCAGLHADRLARMCHLDPQVQIVPFRGDYYELVPERRAMVRGLIYPMPDPALSFLGAHFTRTIDDRVEAGPNAVLAFSREGYAPWTLSPRDFAETLAFPGFWRLARRYWRTGLAELHGSLTKQRFVRSLQQLVPRVGSDDLVRGQSGVRAQAVDRAGQLVDDFHVVVGKRTLHVLNAPSPAATASLAIGGAVARQVLEQL